MNLFFWATLYYLEFHDFKTAKALYVFTLLFCLLFLTAPEEYRTVLEPLEHVLWIPFALTLILSKKKSLENILPWNRSL